MQALFRRGVSGARIEASRLHDALRGVVPLESVASLCPNEEKYRAHLLQEIARLKLDLFHARAECGAYVRAGAYRGPGDRVEKWVLRNGRDGKTETTVDHPSQQ